MLIVSLTLTALIVTGAFQVEENIGLVKAIARNHQAGEFEFARDAKEQQTLWSARKDLFWSTLALRTPNSDIWSTDVAVPLSRLSDIIGKSGRVLGARVS